MRTPIPPHIVCALCKVFYIVSGHVLFFFFVVVDVLCVCFCYKKEGRAVAAAKRKEMACMHEFYFVEAPRVWSLFRWPKRMHTVSNEVGATVQCERERKRKSERERNPWPLFAQQRLAGTSEKENSQRPFLSGRAAFATAASAPAGFLKSFTRGRNSFLSRFFVAVFARWNSSGNHSHQPGCANSHPKFIALPSSPCTVSAYRL